SYIRGRDRALDRIIFQFNNLLADGTIFQSSWSRDKNYELGIKKCPYETTIINAPNPTIFHPESSKLPGKGKKGLIATSWSGNIRRGFETYQYLDEHLDFDRFEMTFVGNSPVQFKNIKWIKPVPSKELAIILREHDVYITASINDPCSNSLLEALHCGLPAVARNDGGHPEIIGEAGAFFENGDGAIDAIEKVANNHGYYQARIDLATLDDVGQEYYEFAQTIYEDCLNSNYRPKQVNLFSNMNVRIRIAVWKAQNKLQGMKKARQ
ncbi:glycosyltransferase family 4 protein, partial [Chloroflexota bacterium]